IKQCSVNSLFFSAPGADGTRAKQDKIGSSLKIVKKDTAKPEKLKYKPLTGKVFYLDIPSKVVSEKIGKDLRELGGRVESFLSKDISYLVSCKKEAKFAPALGQISPVPSPESAQHGGNSSSHPANQKDRRDGSSFKITDKVRMSRGKSLVEKAIKEQDLIPSGSILSNALSWGVKILHIDDVKNYIEQKKKELYPIKGAGSSFKDVVSAGKLKNPFVKVEDGSRRYRPFYLQLPTFPVLNYCVPKPYSPFEVEKKLASGQKQTQSKQRNKTNSDKDCGTLVQLPQKDKKRRGYCECCGKKYEDLQTHLASEQHRNFARSTQYQVVDDIISTLVYEFVEYKDDTKEIKRTKCSTGYFRPMIGKITKPDELKERLKKQRISLRSYLWKDRSMQALKLERQPAELQPNSVPIPTPLPASVCSVLYCHQSQPLELKNTFRNDENIKTEYSCTANLRETLVPLDFILAPPQKADGACTENLSPAYEPFSKEIVEAEINKKTIECFQEGMCTLYHSTGQNDNNLSQPKRKLNNAVVLPAKCLKKADANPTLDEEHGDLCDNHQQIQHNIVVEAEVADTAINKELNESAASPAHSSPSAKLCRKVKLYLGRNKRETQKQTTELSVKYTEGSYVPEENRSPCSSALQALLELFQSSETTTEFGGFSSYSEPKGWSSTQDTWEGQRADLLWSLFSSSSSSPFAGF
ncbi:DBF4A protein, partial [Turnix velox]|nr:DBF4A protein [Turnix velox]